MKRKRKQYSGDFKAKVGLEALMVIKTTAQIARENNVHPLLPAVLTPVAYTNGEFRMNVTGTIGPDYII